ncbi:serine/threonine-protein kinase [Saccharopolyspora indica]|uniref:serine/threonine-protein kinase n=1 Tax=Saccharopolyspora indica TaxID=1229659 RepID=UPI0022EB5710|nr:serine/threonine-protein kinase [Saccharopolyspora indica]MDA3647938.1 serine/threonine-protein kinase [Saccharopolyspora indica]
MLDNSACFGTAAASGVARSPMVPITEVEESPVVPNPGESAQGPRVYVFRARDSEAHIAQVIKFATMLREGAGIDADLPEWSPPQRSDQVIDAIAWSDEADFILVIASPEMKRLMDSMHPGDPEGVIGAALARDSLAENLPRTLKKMLPVVLPGRAITDIPRMLAGYSRRPYVISHIDTEDPRVQDLLRVLRNSPLHAKPSQGPPHPITQESNPPHSADTPPPVLNVILCAGETILLNDQRLLVHNGVELPGGEGGPEVLRQAPAMLIGEPHEWVWLKQVEQKVQCSGELFASLAAEYELTEEISRDQEAVPRPLALLDEDRTRTLVLSWPRRDEPPKRFATLADYTPYPDELDSIVVRRTLAALAGLADPLTALHRRGHSHRELAPQSIVRIDDENLALRDLGASTRTPVPGEHATYPAPEQTFRGRGRIGPWTDAYQLAAVAYHQISGHRPRDSASLPVRQVCPVAPEAACTAIDAALDPVPARRPTVADLASAFRK